MLLALYEIIILMRAKDKVIDKENIIVPMKDFIVHRE